VRKTSQRAVLILTLALVSCGDSGVDVLPTANLVKEGTGFWTNCTTFVDLANTCDFTASGSNRGPGCASSIRATIKFLDDASA
jgi:hypothetical protein